MSVKTILQRRRPLSRYVFRAPGGGEHFLPLECTAKAHMKVMFCFSEIGINALRAPT